MCGRYQLTTEENIQEIQEIVAEIYRRYMDKPILSQMKLGEIRPTDEKYESEKNQEKIESSDADRDR